MEQWEISTLSLLMAAIQATGLFSAWLARRSEGSDRQAFCQGLFVLCLAGVGGATIFSLLVNGGWVVSGTTLAIMVVGVTYEFRSPQRQLVQ